MSQVAVRKKVIGGPLRVSAVYSGALDALEQPRVVRLGPGLVAAVFELMKLPVARFLIRRARRNGYLRPHGCVIESTSGSMGLALAYVCREFGHPLVLFGDPAIDDNLNARLTALGAVVRISARKDRAGGFQAARLRRLRAFRVRHPNSYWPRQYENPFVLDAYRSVAEHLDRHISVDYLVAPVSTGGSACGILRGLRELGHATKLVAVDTHKSVLFGQQDGPRVLRGIGNSIMPKNLDRTLVDQCHWVSASEAVASMMKAYRTHLLDIGPTSGAAFLVAQWVATRHPRKQTVFVCPDDGERYRCTFYNPRWLHAQRIPVVSEPTEPTQVTAPTRAKRSWSYMDWHNRP
jgi:S-sulfo-L-cysteine synthase (3-phospho-L-serine-dependent)